MPLFLVVECKQISLSQKSRQRTWFCLSAHFLFSDNCNVQKESGLVGSGATKNYRMALDSRSEGRIMFQKFEAEIAKEIEGQTLVFRVILLKIRIGNIEHWSYSTSLSALSGTGETLSIKTFA